MHASFDHPACAMSGPAGSYSIEGAALLRQLFVSDECRPIFHLGLGDSDNVKVARLVPVPAAAR